MSQNYNTETTNLRFMFDITSNAAGTFHCLGKRNRALVHKNVHAKSMYLTTIPCQFFFLKTVPTNIYRTTSAAQTTAVCEKEIIPLNVDLLTIKPDGVFKNVFIQTSGQRPISITYNLTKNDSYSSISDQYATQVTELISAQHKL
uniref:LysM domain-containing protein n=2 Tax=Glossina palpalis gambiensis TaxID=67801 RepID=A0A1B0BXH0_9MUSC